MGLLSNFEHQKPAGRLLNFSGLFGRHGAAFALLFAMTFGLIAMAAAVTGRPGVIVASAYGNPAKALLFTIPAVFWMLFIAARLLARKVRRPLAILRRMAWRDRYWLIRTALLFALTEPAATAFSILKRSVPQFVPFYADPQFAAADRFLFGADPWRLTHAVIGPLGTVMLDRIYILYFLVLVLTLIWLCTTRDLRFQIRGLLSFVAIWLVLGVVMATMMSSVGPMFYRDFYHEGTFDPLLQRLHAIDAASPLKLFEAADWLRTAEHAGTIGAGIAAMPSLHVGKAWFAVLLVQHRFGRHWLTAASLAFFAAMWIASVHLGWHYAVDGMVSVIMVTAIWVGFGKLVDGRAPHRAGDAVRRGGLAPALARL